MTEGESRSRGRRRKRRPGRTSSGGASGSRSCSSGSSHSFRKPSTRGEDELWRQSKEYGQAPGADSLASGVPHYRGGKKESSTAGGGSWEAARAGEQGEAPRQIGTRRRGEKPRSSRDATPGEGVRRSGKRSHSKGSDRKRSPRDRRRPASERKRIKLEATWKGGSENEAEERPRERKRPPESLVDKGAAAGGGKGESSETPDTYEEVSEQESLETVQLSADADHSIEVMRAWLQKEECGGLTVAQSGALLALAVFRSGTPVGKLLSRNVLPGSDDGGVKGTRQRSLLPLPLWPDSREALKELFNSGEFRRLAGDLGHQEVEQGEGSPNEQKNGSAYLAWAGCQLHQPFVVRRR